MPYVSWNCGASSVRQPSRGGPGAGTTHVARELAHRHGARDVREDGAHGVGRAHPDSVAEAELVAAHVRERLRHIADLHLC
jgi:hypothetical protein